MDLSKLTPVPWTVDTPGCVCHQFKEGGARTIAMPGNSYNPWPQDVADAEFIALARNAFDVMMRRYEWAVQSCTAGDYSIWWEVRGNDGNEVVSNRWPDPFTALIEADKWYRENVENTNLENRA